MPIPLPTYLLALTLGLAIYACSPIYIHSTTANASGVDGDKGGCLDFVPQTLQTLLNTPDKDLPERERAIRNKLLAYKKAYETIQHLQIGASYGTKARALIYAAAAGDTATVETLMEETARSQDDRRMVIAISLQFNQLPTAQQLLGQESLADLYKGEWLTNGYIAASFANADQATRAFIWQELGDRIKENDDAGHSLLLYAVAHENEPALAFLLQESISINAKEAINENTPLHSAAAEGYVEAIQLLLKHGANVTATNKYEETPLHNAVYLNHPEVVQALIAVPDINLNAADKDGCTPLHYATYEGHLEIAALLMALPGIKVNATDKDGETPLHYAAYQGQREMVQSLVSAPGIQINQVDNSGWSPLHYAADLGHVRTTRVLTEMPGIRLNKADKEGWRPLHNAASAGHANIIKVLVAAPGIHINAADKNGWTPLHNAASTGHVDVVQALVDAGAHTSLTNTDGQRPLDIAQDRQSTWAHQEIYRAQYQQIIDILRPAS